VSKRNARNAAGAVVLATLLSAPARADGTIPFPGPGDRVEAVQRRPWAGRRLALAPLAAGGLDDPFLWRGGVGLRATAWPRSLLGLSLEASLWGQTPSQAARTAQRELRAVLRPGGSFLSLLAQAEIAGGDGKIAFGSRIVPFEIFLRAGAGAAGAGTSGSDGFSPAFAGSLGTRWFISERLGLELALAARSAVTQRVVGGVAADRRDTVVALETAVPLRIGGAP